MGSSSIRASLELKKEIEKFRKYPKESQEDILKRLIETVKKNELVVE